MTKHEHDAEAVALATIASILLSNHANKITLQDAIKMAENILSAAKNHLAQENKHQQEAADANTNELWAKLGKL
ncbi:MAG TPA: hypothetical protein VGH51_22700 [Candidatus Angelobacter sp.]